MKALLTTLTIALPAVALLSACASAPDAASLAKCSDQCQSHTDGYEWAQRANLSDDSVCAGYPAAFVEGCKDGIEDLRQLRPSSQGI